MMRLLKLIYDGILVLHTFSSSLHENILSHAPLSIVTRQTKVKYFSRKSFHGSLGIRQESMILNNKLQLGVQQASHRC